VVPRRWWLGALNGGGGVGTAAIDGGGSGDGGLGRSPAQGRCAARGGPGPAARRLEEGGAGGRGRQKETEKKVGPDLFKLLVFGG
jgi:hypothetical protein